MNETPEAAPSQALKPLPSRSRRLLRIVMYGGLALLAAELLFIAWSWPNWDELRQGKVPESALIKAYLQQREDEPKLPPLRWKPVQSALPKAVKKVFVLAEDSRFYEHHGFDWEAINDAIEYNYRHGRVLMGASTISQQTAKNMFLSLSRNPLRKWHEVLFTYLLEAKLEKAQILHIYLNIAEFGPGIYGLEAAARQYYGVGAQQLSASQAVELAASLPSPRKNNPKTRTRPFQRRVQRIAHTMNAIDRYAGRLAPKEEVRKKLEELRREMQENPFEPTPAGEAADVSASENLDSSVLDAESSPSEVEAAGQGSEGRTGDAIDADAPPAVPADTSPPEPAADPNSAASPVPSTDETDPSAAKEISP